MFLQHGWCDSPRIAINCAVTCDTCSVPLTASHSQPVTRTASSSSECQQVHPPSFVLLLLLLLKDAFFATSNHTHCSPNDLRQATDACICMIAYTFVVYSSA